jgi:DNA polymerase III epsilon subunit-like protein
MRDKYAQVNFPAPDGKSSRKLYLTYDQSKDYSWQPVDKPYEKRVKLSFNYWQCANAQILTEDVGQLILDILFPRTSRIRDDNFTSGVNSLGNMKGAHGSQGGNSRPRAEDDNTADTADGGCTDCGENFDQGPKFGYLKFLGERIHSQSIIFVAMHGIDSRALGQDIAKTKFLSKCSSLPLRHSSVSINDSNWAYFEARSLNSLMLWPRQYALDWAKLAVHHSHDEDVRQAFVSHTLFFQVTNYVWVDQLIFTADYTVPTFLIYLLAHHQNYNNLPGKAANAEMKNIYGEQQNLNESPKRATSPSEYSPRAGDIYGRFRRGKVNDAGVFVYRPMTNEIDTESGFLLLVWYGHMASKSVLEVTTTKFQISALGKSRFVFESSFESKGEESKFQLVFQKAFHNNEYHRHVSGRGSRIKPFSYLPVDILQAKAAHDSKTLQHNVNLEANITVDNDSDEKLTHSSVQNEHFRRKSGEVLKRVCAGWQSAAPSDIESLLIGKNLMDVSGYPVLDTSSTLKFLCTRDFDEWRAYQRRKHGIDSEHFDDTEEGECAGDSTQIRWDDDHLNIPVEDVDETKVLDVCGLDCEMCVAGVTIQLTRATLVCPFRGVVLDTLVKPDLPITDYCTAYSGITEDLLAEVTTTIFDLHKLLRPLIGQKTVLVGHSLDSDLRALRLCHSRCIDTALLYPHPKGLPYRYPLRKVALELLGENMQQATATGVDEVGHDSVLDALVALEVAVQRLKCVSEGLSSNGSLVGIETPFRDGLQQIQCQSLINTIFDRQSKLKADNVDFPNEGNTDTAIAKRRRLEFSGDVNCSIFACSPFYDLPTWTRCVLGYRPDGDATFLADYLPPSAKKTKMLYSSPKEAFNAMTAELRANVTKNSKRFTFLDMTLKSVTASGAGEAWDSLLEADIALVDIFELATQGTLMLVVPQGSLASLHMWIAEKQRCKWERQKRSNHTAQSDTMSRWDDEKEMSLIKAAAHVLASCLFIRQK